MLDHRDFVCEGTGENIFVVADGAGRHAAADRLDPRRHQPPVGHADLARSRLPRSSSATSPAPSCTLADELFLTGTAAELVPINEIDDHAVGDGRPGPITRAVQKAFDDALHGRDRALPRVAGPVPVPRASMHPWSERITEAAASAARVRHAWAARLSSSNLERTHRRHDTDPALRHHPARRHAGRGMSLSADEKLRVVHALDELGIDFIEAGFPTSNPKEDELFALLRARALAHADDRRLRHDAPARRGRRRGRRPARAGRVLRAGLHARRQDLGLHLEKVVRVAREENLAMIADSVAFLVAAGQARDLRRRALLRRLPRRPRLRAALPAGRARAPAPSSSCSATPTARRCPSQVTRGGRATCARRSARRRASASTATTTPAAASPTRSPRSRPARARSRAR